MTYKLLSTSDMSRQNLTYNQFNSIEKYDINLDLLRNYDFIQMLIDGSTPITLMHSDGTTEWSHTADTEEPISVPLPAPLVLNEEVTIKYETTSVQKVTFFELRGCVFEGTIR